MKNIMNETITPRERMARVLKHRVPDRVSRTLYGEAIGGIKEG